mgnify:CR=1 FL=1
MPPYKKTLIPGIFLLLLHTFSSYAETENRSYHHLPESTGPRFEIPDRIWPENPGDANICLWKDDKLGAVTITIDDNQAGQIDWWMEQGDKYGYRFTWFIITNWVETKGIGGTWEQFQTLIDRGHDVQSHTASHLGDKAFDIDDEYRISQEVIEKNLPGHPATALAFPGGGQSSRNDPEVAAKYFIGVRAGSSIINPVNRINYMGVNSVSGQFVFNKPKHWANLDYMIERSSQKKLYRGWYCNHFHNLNEKDRTHVLEGLTYLKEHDADFWVGLFREVAMYGQERETAEVESKVLSPNEIALSLSDHMDDKFYNVPLTVKVRLPDDWQSAIAGQDQNQIECNVITHENGKFALIQVVPDKGTVILRRD